MDPKMYPQGSQSYAAGDLETTRTITDLIETFDATNSNQRKVISLLNMLKIPASAKTANYTLTVNDHMKAFTNRGATGAVTFTLPAPVAGFIAFFLGAADQTWTIAAATNGDIVYVNDLAANSVAWSTSSEKIGGAALVWSDGTSMFVVALQGTGTVAT